MPVRLSERFTLDDIQKSSLQHIYDLPASDLQDTASDILKSRAEFDSLAPFFSRLSPSECSTALRACLLLFHATNGTKIPRQMQLEAVIPVISRKDSLVNAGTGSGKTICMVLAVLLDPASISLVISPLKRLQITQVAEFCSFGIRAMNINADTPSDDHELWNRIEKGYYSVIIVAPESLDNFDGHLPRVARLVRSERLFSRAIKRVYVDETHNIYTAGTPLYGLAAHRPAYGFINKLRVYLEKGTPIQALSGTLPEHITNAVVDNLGFRSGYATITFTTNRPNLTYATQPVVGSLSDFRNLDFVVPPKHKTIIFFDSKVDVRNATTYLDNHVNLPEASRGHGVVQEYHGDMSSTYLTKTFDAFAAKGASASGLRILCATSSCATGIDISDIAVVVQYGICRDIPDWRQRGGRAGRDPAIPALFLTLYEPWVAKVDLTKVTTDPTDPDKPISRLTKTSTKQERTGFASIHFMQSSECIRLLSCQYFGDQTLSKLDFTNAWCCERHSDTVGFSTWFSTSFFDGNALREKKASGPKKPRVPVRPQKERGSLISQLQDWRLNVHRNDPLRAFRTMAMIIDDKSIKLIAGIASARLSVETVVETLGEVSEWRDEWAEKIVKVIEDFDAVQAGSSKESPTREAHSNLEDGTVCEVESEDSSSEHELESGDSSDDEPLAVLVLRNRF